MKKELQRGLLGIPLGITISSILAIIISLCIGNGEFYACVPSLAESVGGELNGVMLQTALSGILGAAFGAASVIWEIDSWSLAKQSAIYFAVASIVMFPIAYLAEWMEHSITGFLIYFAVFTGIFAAVWLSQYLIWKKRIKKINSEIS